MKIDTGILPDGRRGKHMNEVDEILEQLIHKIATTKEYNQYMTMLDRIKSQPDLYRRIGEFRRRSLAIQMSESNNKIQENNNLQNEYRDLLTNGLSNDFFVAEHQYCGMIQAIQNELLENAHIDTGFLED